MNSSGANTEIPVGSTATDVKQHILALAQIALETIKEAGEQGAPEGPMYAAFMTVGMSIDHFQAMIAGLERAGLIRRSGHVCYYIPRA